MNKSIFTLLSCAALATPAMFAEEAVAPEAIAEPTAEAVAEPVAEPQSDFADFLKKMPVKISGYLQTGWNYTSNKTLLPLLSKLSVSACSWTVRCLKT